MPGFKFFQDRRPSAKEVARLSKAKVIFVEGIDECLMFDSMLVALGADEKQIEIIPYDGKQKFTRNLDALLKQDPFQDDEVSALAVIQDADVNCAATKADIIQIMGAQGLPATPFGSFTPKRGSNKLHYGAFIFPDNKANGNLETLLMSTVSSRQQAIDATEYVDAYISHLDKDNSKRKAQTFLSVQKELCRGAGQGARDGYFDLRHMHISTLMKFLQAFLAIAWK